MGYTHYWDFKKEVPQDLWVKVLDDLKKITKGASIIEVTNETDYFSFNGIGSLSHEDFHVKKQIKLGADNFNFCKTDQKPYDEYVTACLIVFHNRLNDYVKVASDGEPSDWEAGLKLAKRKLKDKTLVNLNKKPLSNTAKLVLGG